MDISDSSVHDYQKTGILINGQGTSVNVTHNYVSGIGSTPNIAQNGIQISRGASATVVNNFVNNYLYAGCITPDACPAGATNILVYHANGISVRNNTAGSAQIGIDVLGDNVQVLNNDVYDNKVFDGIVMEGNNNRASSNNVYHSDQIAIQAAGNNNRIDGNTINEAIYGTNVYSGSGNQVSGNKYYNVVVPNSVVTTSMGAAGLRSATFLPRVSPYQD